MDMILQKYLAQAGLCSRRQAEKHIRDGRVAVNGRTAELGDGVREGNKVFFDGRRVILSEKKIYIILNKPKGYTCTNRNFPGEKNIFSLLKQPQRLFAAGRLDKESRGLVLLTNDGDLTVRLTHPRFAHEKKYLVKLYPARAPLCPEEQVIGRLRAGLDIGAGDGVARIKSGRRLAPGYFEIMLAEGKKRQIRRLFQKIGYPVKDIRRVAIGALALGGLPEGQWRNLSAAEIRSLAV